MLVALSACGTRGATNASVPAATTTTAAGTTGRGLPLSHSRWWITEVTLDGNRLTAPSGRSLGGELRFLDHLDCTGKDATECYAGPQMVGDDACNGVSRKVTIDAHDLTLGDEFGIHTLMACSGPLPDTLDRFFRSSTLRYSIVGNQLSMATPSGDIVVTYQALTTPFGPTTAKVVVDGSTNRAPFRLVWNQGLTVEMRDDIWSTTGGASVGVDPGRVNAMRVDVGGRQYLFGIVPAATARATYQPYGGAVRTLTLHELGDATSKAVGQFVDDDTNGWKLTAYDAAGRVIHTLDWSPTSTSPSPTPPPPPTS
jgi:hypothetical protein